jgi:ferredoxin
MMTAMPDTAPFRVTLLPGDDTFDCTADQPLLLAGLAAGVSLSWSCRNGSCRSCIALLVDGRIEHTIPWPGLSAEEKAEGWVLPCVACPRSDVTLQRAAA